MIRNRPTLRNAPGLLAAGAVIGLLGCGPTADFGATSRPSLRAFRSVSGTVPVADAAGAGIAVTRDGASRRVVLDHQGRFRLSGVAAGDHSIFVAAPSGETVEVPFRVLPGSDLGLGTIAIRGGRLEGISGSDGFGFGYADEDGDGRNDLFADEDGDGVNDVTGTPFSQPFGYADDDADGVNDLFTDADGDGVNDVTGEAYDAVPRGVAQDRVRPEARR